MGRNVSSNINIQKSHIFYCDGTRIRKMKLDGTEDINFYETSDVLLDFSITENALYYEYRTGTKYNEEFHNKLVLLD